MDCQLPPTAHAPSTLRHLLAADDDDERACLVGALVHGLGFDWLSHGPARLERDGTASLTDPWHGIGASDWQRRYRACGHERRDPRLAAALSSRLPVVWRLDALAREAAPRQRAFVEDLTQTGMRSGVMLALGASRADERTVVCMLSRRPDDDLADDDTRLGQVITLGLCLRELESCPPAAPAPSTMSATQRAILQYLACGLCDKQIAGRLALSLHTVDYHLRQLRKRFGARNRVQLVQAAAEVKSRTE